MGRIKYLSLLFLLAFNPAFGQNSKIDSLLSENKNHVREDSLKVILLQNIFRQYTRLRKMDEVENYSKKAIVLAQKIGLKEGLANVYYHLGRSYHGTADYRSALSFYEKGIALYKAINKPDKLAAFYLNLGALYMKVPDYSRSLEAHQKAVTLYETLKNKRETGSCLMNISEIYRGLNQYTKAIEYGYKALRLFEESGSSRGICVAYDGIATSYMKASDSELLALGIKPSDRYSSVLENLSKSLAIAKQLNDNSVAGPVTKHIGKVHDDLGNKELALQHYLAALKINVAEDDKVEIASSLITIGNHHAENNRFLESFDFLERGLQLAKQIEITGLELQALNSMSGAYEKAGQYRNSLAAYKQYIVLKERISNDELEKEIIRRQLQLDFGIKEREYILKKQIVDGELEQQVLLAKDQQQQLILKQQQLEIIGKERSLQRLSFLKKQADLENDRRLQATRFRQQQLTTRYNKKISDEQINAQKEQIFFNEKLNTTLIIISGLIFGTAVLLFYSKRKMVKLNKLVLKQKSDLEELVNIKDRIFSVVSHDMRAPVNTLIAFTQILEYEDVSPDRLAVYAKELRNTLSHTSSLMDNLLNWASSQMQGFNPVMEKFDLHFVAGEAINSLMSQSQTKKIQITNNITNGTLIYADINMTLVVLRNIIGNAIKYSYNKGQITLTSTSTDKQVTLSIRDNGTGMTEKQVINFNSGRYLQSFESKPGTNKEKGTGLGLVLSKNFTTLMQGEVWLKSEVNKGSEFLITFRRESLMSKTANHLVADNAV